MQQIFADLHIHIGRTQTGKPVKITGSKSLTIQTILEEASLRKGLGMIGVIDCHVPEVLAELKQLIRQGKASMLPGGGLRYEKMTLILGTEMEFYDEDCQGPVHVLCFLPTIEEMSFFSSWMSKYQKNITLSSQRSYAPIRQCQKIVKELGGLFIPAHIFTPHKSVYGRGVKSSITEILNPDLIDAVELGLSSDTAMADQLPELRRYTFLTNSDAHSVSKIAREYQLMSLEEVDFTSLAYALRGIGEGGILGNYGLSPRLGKYYSEVSRRIEELEILQKKEANNSVWAEERHRPPYTHQIPLEFIPKLGPKGFKALLHAYGTEMNIIHHCTFDELTKYVRDEVAHMILAARKGSLAIHSGGAGLYGKIGK
ncbi:endonuclease Q family protein [Bacillus horti]|uniref:Uncharacterized protein (TIGR00375 family) n=1 Tax=Caldalkalibacillus horti TaxID=77523 RepID=A0ABT9VU60_9BACI|nr:endonuclease Q family protein [Bacillus horti]MDQ0164523.1 uncharacterized protein (TIGR00375 family) [Bacillus horti]